MRINKLVLNGEVVKAKGLKPFESDRFSNAMVLVGKNGSGKSRYLDLIYSYLTAINENNFLEKFKYFPNIIEKNIWFKMIIAKKKAVDARRNRAPNTMALEKEYGMLARIYNDRVKGVDKRRQRPEINVMDMLKKYVKIVDQEDIVNVARFMEQKNEIGEDLEKILNSPTGDNLKLNEVEIVKQSSIHYFNQLPHKLAADEIEAAGDAEKFQNGDSYKRYVVLKELIETLLEKELSWVRLKADKNEHPGKISMDVRGEFRLDGIKFDYEKLSHGQRLLFAYVMILFLQGANTNVKLNQSIIIIDEPELHLHPEAKINLIDKLIERTKDYGQLIIATHSLSIISSLDYESIYLVEDGEMFKPRSDKPYESIKNLLGLDDSYKKFNEFISSIPAWAMSRFMTECFESPDVIEFSREGDPQIEQIKKILKGNEKINILDFGCGKGRLLQALKESDSIWKRVENYDCFDVDVSNNQLLKEKGAKRTINKLSVLEKNKYDFAIVLNVLHEIDINDWVKTINKIVDSLKKDGFLILVEDNEIPIGELPNDNGLLLLGEKEMKHLLSESSLFVKHSKDAYKDRITCCVVKADLIKKINKEKVLSTLKILKERMFEEIEDMKGNGEIEKDNSHKYGRLFALKTVNYVDAESAIRKLEHKAQPKPQPKIFTE